MEGPPRRGRPQEHPHDQVEEAKVPPAAALPLAQVGHHARHIQVTAIKTRGNGSIYLRQEALAKLYEVK